MVSVLRTALGLPLWILQLATGAKSFRDNPLLGSQRLNRLGLHGLRVRAAHAMAWYRRGRLARQIAPKHRAAFDADGFIQIDDYLPAAEFAALRAAILTTPAPAREMIQGDTITRRIAIDGPFRRAVPAIVALLESTRWRGLTRYVASDRSAPLYYIQTILTHQADAPADPQTHLHADTFHPTMKAWYFLNDVAEDEGPFSYVPGSHRLTPARRAWEIARSVAAPAGLDPLSQRGSLRIAPEELAGLGLPPARLFGVRANTLIVADTCGFHARGPSVRPTRRVEIWAYGRRNPFLPWTGLAPLSLPGVAEQRIPWLWAAKDRWPRLFGMPWHNAGMKTPLGD